MRLEVGNQYGDHLLRLKDAIDKSDDKYQEAKIDHAAFTAAAIRAGVLISHSAMPALSGSA